MTMNLIRAAWRWLPLTLLVAVSVLGPLFVLDANAQDLALANRPPWTDGHLLGTDQLGRDVLARITVGLRSSMLVCLVGVVIAAVIGVPLGMVSGYLRGPVDSVLMRLVDVQLAIPAMLLVLTLASLLQPGFWTVGLVLGLSGWIVFARVSRAQTLALGGQEMLLAIRSLGSGHLRLLTRHVLPNVAGPLAVMAALEMATLVMAEAALGYLGLGVPPPTPTLGGMVASGQGHLLAGAWWLVVFPGLAIAVAVIAINVLGDRLRDRLDPRAARLMRPTSLVRQTSKGER